MNWPKLLVLVRHGESFVNQWPDGSEEIEKSNFGTWEYPLSVRGQCQGEITGEYIRKRFGAFDRYYTSYYVRALQTMRIMYPGTDFYEDPRLAEKQHGIFETLSDRTAAQAYPLEVKRKNREGLYHYRPPGGESLPDVEFRVRSFLGTLCEECSGKRVLLVVHSHWSVLFQKIVHRLSIKETENRFRAVPWDTASVNIYRGSALDWKEQLLRKRSRLVLLEENIVPWKKILP